MTGSRYVVVTVIIAGVAVAALGIGIANSVNAATNCVSASNSTVSGRTVSGRASESCSTAGTLTVLLVAHKSSDGTVTLARGSTLAQRLTVSGTACVSRGLFYVTTLATWTRDSHVHIDSSQTLAYYCRFADAGARLALVHGS